MMQKINKTECFGIVDKYILFGGGLLVISSAKRLKELGLEVFVVTSERHSKEMRCIDSKTKTLLEWLDDDQIEYVISEDISIDERVLSSISATTIGISFGAAWIFKQKFIDLFNGNLLNTHGSQLPKNRGGGGFSWIIMQGERLSGSLIHKVNQAVDTGDVVFSKEYNFPEKCKTPLDYQKYSANRYIELLDIFFDKVKNLDSFDISVQQEKYSSYWPRLSTDTHGFIDWNWSLIDIERFICAFDEPYDGASTFINGVKVRVKNCYSSFDDGPFHPFKKGLIYRKNDNSVFVASENGSIIINQVLDDKGHDMKQKLQVGDRFYTPHNFIEESMEFRAVYTPTGLKN